MKPDLSIIIISYNTIDITKRCLDSIFESFTGKQDFLVEVIVLDNDSTDGTKEMLQHYNHKKVAQSMLHLHFSKENLGFSKGNNKAVSYARGDTLLLLNSDTESFEGSIQQLYHYFHSKENPFSIVGAKLIERDRSTPQPSCGPAYTLLTIIMFLFLAGDRLHITRYSPDIVKEVAWVSGACFIMKKEEYLALDGFDEGIFMYMEEIDLMHRARIRGMRVGFYPHSRFIHLGSASSQKRTEPIIQVYRGYLYFYKKHHSQIQLVLLKSLLQLKALVALAIGKITGNDYLKNTYEKALAITQDY